MSTHRHKAEIKTDEGEKDMKKKIAMALVVGLVLSCLQGCGSSDAPKEDTTTTTEQTDADQDENNSVQQEDTDTESITTEEEIALKHYDPTPEILEATWGDGKFQVADMVFCINNTMSMDEVAAIVEASETDLQLVEYQNPDYDEDFPPQLYAMNKEGDAASLFEWTWHSVDKQRYYDVAEGEEGWYLSGFYEGADIESLVGCDRDSWYIDGGIPVDPTPGTCTITLDDIIEEYQSLGIIEDKSKKSTFYEYLKYANKDATEIPIGFYSNNGYLTIQDNYWTGTLDPKGNERFESIIYSLYFKDDGTFERVFAISIKEQCYKKELLDIIERNHK